MKYNVKKDSFKFKKKTINFFIAVGLQATRRCNLRCIHCCEPEQIKDASLEKIKLAVDKLAAEGLEKICVTGGEPLLREDLPEILKHIHSKGIYVTLSTNGTLLTKEKLQEIKPFLDNISFSLHGKETTHDEITLQKGSYKKVIESIAMANELGLPVLTVMSVFSKNAKEMIEVAKICEENKVEKLYFFSLIARGRSATDFGKKNTPFKELEKELERIQSLSKKEAWNLETTLFDWSVEGQCALIFPNGNLVAVPSFKDKDHTKIVGNIFKESAKELWNRYPFKENYIEYYKLH